MEFFMVKGSKATPKLRIRFTMGQGKVRGGNQKIRDFVKDEYVGKQFNVSKTNRTKIVRLFMDSLRPCTEDNLYIKKRITHFLRRYYLSRAERHAILFKLGYRYSKTNSIYLRNMEINGYLKWKRRS